MLVLNIFFLVAVINNKESMLTVENIVLPFYQIIISSYDFRSF